MLRRAIVLLAILIGGAALASADASAPPSATGPEAFGKVRDRLMNAKGAVVVSTACGSTSSPWAYRGKRGKALELNAYSQADQDQAWSHDFVSALLRSADWDSAHKFHGLSKPCDQTHQVPLVAVRWEGWADTYALLSLDVRRALLFQGSRPLGMVDFETRADTILSLIRKALVRDSLVQAMSLPPRAEPPRHDEPGFFASLDRLPQVLGKVPPVYPPDAIEEKREGTISVKALIGTDGHVRDAYVAESSRRVRDLSDAAIEAVWKWKFAPATSGGRAVPVWVAVPVKFSLR